MLRAGLDMAMVLRTADDIFAEPAMAARVRAAGAGWREAGILGPSRAELVAMAHS